MANPILQQIPNAPDLTFQAYQREVDPNQSKIGNFFTNLFGRRESWQDWSARKQTEYNNQVKDIQYNNEQYYNWLSSPEGQRTQIEDAGYNPNLLTPALGSGSGSAGQGMMSSPVPVDPAAGDPQNMLLGGISTALQIMTGFANLKGTLAKAKGQEIQNEWIDRLNHAKERGLRLGSDADELELSQLLTAVFGEDMGNLVHFGEGDYQVGSDMMRGFKYRQETSNLDLFKARIRLVQAQKGLSDLNASERDYLNKNYLPLLIESMSGKNSLLSKELELKDSQISKQGAETMNTFVQAVSGIIRLIRTFL